MSYRVIAYKPNSVNYCMGNRMCSYSSEFIHLQDLTLDEAVREIAQCLAYDRDVDEVGYQEFLVFCDDVLIVDTESILAGNGSEFMGRVDVEVQRIKAGRLAEIDRLAAEKRLAEARTKEEQERQEYLRLHQKYGGA